MKRVVLFSFLSIMCSVVAAYANLCMTDYSVLIVLDKDSGNKVKYGAPQINDMNWRVDVNYDTLATINGVQRNVRGIVSCSEFGDNSVMYDVNTSGVIMSGDKTGGNCWCSMLRPATTYSMFVRSFEDVDACVANCAKSCADGLVSSYQFRDKFFEAIW